MCRFDISHEFHTIPFWRRDLIDEYWLRKNLLVRKSRVNPIRAVIGNPQHCLVERKICKKSNNTKALMPEELT